MPTDELDQLDFVFDSLSKHLTKDEHPGLLEMPGIKPEQMAGLFGAAAGCPLAAVGLRNGDHGRVRQVFEVDRGTPWS